jgi:hypothetical protein
VCVCDTALEEITPTGTQEKGRKSMFKDIYHHNKETATAILLTHEI